MFEHGAGAHQHLPAPSRRTARTYMHAHALCYDVVCPLLPIDEDTGFPARCGGENECIVLQQRARARARRERLAVARKGRARARICLCPCSCARTSRAGRGGGGGCWSKRGLNINV